jgi:hypothetical protein
LPLVHFARKIYRQGCLFHSTGLFGQPIPVVGTIIDSAAGTAAGSGVSFMMQGYTHVHPPTAAAAPEQEYSQFEFYSFHPSAQVTSPTSDTSSAPPMSVASGPPSSSGSGSITSSMVDAHANGATPILALPVDEHSNLSSAFHSPLHSPSQQDASASPTSSAGGHGSTHLFDSASFASLHMQHFDQAHGEQKDNLSPLLSPVSTPPLSASGIRSITPLQRYAIGLGPRAELWSGMYRVIQSPAAVDVSASSSSHPPAESARPRIEVTYRISIVVERLAVPAQQATQSIEA